MNRLIMIVSLSLLPAAAHADFLDTVKSVASKPEVQAAAKQAGNKAVEAVKKSDVAKSATGKVEKEINARLLSEAAKISAASRVTAMS